MPATPTVNPTKAALEAAVLDLTDTQITEALRKVDPAVRAAYKDRETYAWPREAQRTLLEALARRLAQGRKPAST
jgi:mannitol-1-phosphate/altronate dehydrogenase